MAIEITVAQFDELKSRCLKARDMSYSPYSNFRVGCALVTEAGDYYCGANVENASYGACICAERAAITQAVLQGQVKIRALAISGDTHEPVTPCGICRQVMREFAPNLVVYMFNNDGTRHLRKTMQDLLPFSFGPEDLGNNSSDLNL